MARTRPNYVPQRTGKETLDSLIKLGEETPSAAISWTVNFRVGLAIDIMVESMAEQRSLSNMIQLLCHEALTAREAKAEASGQTAPTN